MTHLGALILLKLFLSVGLSTHQQDSVLLIGAWGSSVCLQENFHHSRPAGGQTAAGGPNEVRLGRGGLDLESNEGVGNVGQGQSLCLLLPGRALEDELSRRIDVQQRQRHFAGEVELATSALEPAALA